MEANGRESLGQLLRRRRCAAGMSQEELAQQAGLSVRALRNLERGITARPYLGTLELLAGALGLDAAARAELAGATRPPGDADPVTDVPRQLPAVVTGFAGRAGELRTLTGQLAGPRRAVVISAVAGIAGVGKTALAVRWAHQVADRFPGGQLYVNLRGFGPGPPPASPAAVIRDFLEALGVPAARVPVRAQAQADLYRSMTSGRRLLVLLDNARDSEQVIPLLPGGPGCLVLVTSRAPLTGLLTAHGARQVLVDVLDSAEAAELLSRRLGTGRVAADPAAVAQIVALTGRLPLALSVLAARAAASPDDPLADIAAGLRDARGRLDALDGGEVSADVRAAFSWSSARLSDLAGRMFRLLGLHPGPEVSVAAAASLAAAGCPQARRALAELATAGLLTETAAGRYSCHDLVRAYAAELGRARDCGGDRHAAAGRMLDHYLHSAAAARQFIQSLEPAPPPLPPLLPGVLPEEPGSHALAMTWLRTECEVLMSVILAAPGLGWPACAYRLPAVMASYLALSGVSQEWTDIQRAAVAVARRCGDRRSEADALRILGESLSQLGKYDEARTHLTAALEVFDDLADAVGQVYVHTALSGTLLYQGQYAAGLEHARRSLAVSRRAGDKDGQAMALNNMGFAHTHLGHHEEAVACCQQGLELCDEAGNRLQASYTLDTLGLAHFHLGRPAEAIACYRQAIDHARALGSLWGEAETLMHLGDAQHALGETGAAVGTWRQALAILDDLFHPGADEVRAKLAAQAAPASS